MNAYLPQINTLLLTLAVMGSAVCIGFFIPGIQNLKFARLVGWGFLLAETVAIERVCADAPAGFRMLAIIAVMLFSIKSIVAAEAQARNKVRLSFPAWVVFTVFWFGMNPVIFTHKAKQPLSGWQKIVLQGLLNFSIGLFLLFCAAQMDNYIRDGRAERIASTLLLFIGLSMMLHFGLLNMSAGMLRLTGINARKVFNAPVRSTSLNEFWGKRWNLAFTEMAAQIVYRPLVTPFGKTIAMICAFLLSGLLHEAAISLPVKAGFGLPLLYFIIQAALMQVELQLEKYKMPIDKIKWIGWCWTIFWLIAPAPILFHSHFIKEVLWPIIGEK